MKTEERKNKKYIKDILKDFEHLNLNYKVEPCGCHIEIVCKDVETLLHMEKIFSDKQNKPINVRGVVRLTYVNFLKL